MDICTISQKPGEYDPTTRIHRTVDSKLGQGLFAKDKYTGLSSISAVWSIGLLLREPYLSDVDGFAEKVEETPCSEVQGLMVCRGGRYFVEASSEIISKGMLPKFVYPKPLWIVTSYAFMIWDMLG